MCVNPLLPINLELIEALRDVQVIEAHQKTNTEFPVNLKMCFEGARHLLICFRIQLILSGMSAQVWKRADLKV